MAIGPRVRGGYTGGDVLGPLGLFAVSPTYMSQIDHHLGDLLATRV